LAEAEWKWWIVVHLQQVQLDWSASFALMDVLPNEVIGGVVVISMLLVE